MKDVYIQKEYFEYVRQQIFCDLVAHEILVLKGFLYVQ